MMNESGKQSVPNALPAGYASGSTTGSIAPGTNNMVFEQDWMAGSNPHFASSVITPAYIPELPIRMSEGIRQPYLTSLNAPSFGSVMDDNQFDSFYKSRLSYSFPKSLSTLPGFSPMQSSETQELRTGEALLSNVPNNDALEEGLSARLMAKSPSNGMVRSVPNSNPPSRDGTPANISQYRPWELDAGGDYPHSQPSTPQSLSDMPNEAGQRPPSASLDKNTLKEMENRLYKSEYLVKNSQMIDLLQPPRSVETPVRPPSGISSANSPAGEVQEAHMMEENADQENVTQLFQRAQNFTDYFPDNRLGHINMQVSHALKLPSAYNQSNNNNAQAPYVPVRQVMMGFPEGKLMKLDSELTDLDMRGNTENTFQVPSVSSTTPRQSLAPVPQIHPAELNQWTENNSAPMHFVHNVPSDTDKSVKKKRKRCGDCPGCLTKNNCGNCGPCKSVRSHQICKMRKCDELKTKKEKAAAAKASGQLYIDNDSSKSLNGQNSYQENDSLQLPSTPTSFQQDMLLPGPLKNLNRNPGGNNSFDDINSSYPGFPPQNTLIPFNGQSPPLTPIKLESQALSSDHQSLKDFSGAAMHELTTARLKNLVNNRRNLKEQMQNYAGSQNLGSMYSEPSPSPVAASPQNDADAYAQRPPSTPTYMRSRAGSNPSDSGIQSDDAAFLSHPGETTYENLKNLVPTPPDAEQSWQKNGSPTDLENISKSIQNGQNHEEAIKKLIAETENNVNGSLNYPILSQDSLNNFHYQNLFSATNLQGNSTLDSYNTNHSTSDAYSSTPTTSATSDSYATQNPPPPYRSQYSVYPNQELNMQQPATLNETPQTQSDQPQRPPSQDSSLPVKAKTSEESPDPPANGGTSSSSAPSPDQLMEN